jgi:hypothetical protein
MEIFARKERQRSMDRCDRFFGPVAKGKRRSEFYEQGYQKGSAAKKPALGSQRTVGDSHVGRS